MEVKSIYDILKKHGALAGISLFLFLQNKEMSVRLDNVEVKLYNCYEARILNSKFTALHDGASIVHRNHYAILPEQIEIKRERKDEGES